MTGIWFGSATLLAILSTPALARERPAAFLQFGDSVAAPRGFAEMCDSDRALCDSMGEVRIGRAGSFLEPLRAMTRDLMPIEPLQPSLGILPTVAERDIESEGWATTALRVAVPQWRSGATFVCSISIGPVSKRGGPRGIAAASVQPLTVEPTGERVELPASVFASAAFQPISANVMTKIPQVSTYASRTATTPAFMAVGKQEIMASFVSTPAASKMLLKRINARVNAKVVQRSDTATYGRAELWRPAGDDRRAVGDCEDIAIQKRLELVAAKFPPDRLFFAVVYRSGIGLHTVLVARLDDGDVVLDSRVKYIQKWSSAGYSWISAQTPTAPAVWRALV